MSEAPKENMTHEEIKQEQEPGCNPHPCAPHSFDRSTSHIIDRCVCECEWWEPSSADCAALELQAEIDRLNAQPVTPQEAARVLANPEIATRIAYLMSQSPNSFSVSKLQYALRIIATSPQEKDDEQRFSF